MMLLDFRNHEEMLTLTTDDSRPPIHKFIPYSEGFHEDQNDKCTSKICLKVDGSRPKELNPSTEARIRRCNFTPYLEGYDDTKGHYSISKWSSSDHLTRPGRFYESNKDTQMMENSLIYRW